ncbi:hypothetical protein LY90DRAFT_501954 [Neocallimastix californiae]|uniref:Uncharacterized protein n=1 Tax=Neocallimastix californiae TaxID=1754190 RepID=A0A1Y2EW76_9FUNG|nr:hypothetical protein LY90DRAFT_501954 [Neocallimastix californiae]|eukprot:ORY75852.1 hypothetical protein LY90DRAFT_501954 [Neocallimastix californiae]
MTDAKFNENNLTTLNMSNNNSKCFSMSTSRVASHLLIESFDYFKQYEEEERDKDNFDDLDFSDIGIDDLKSRLDSYNHKYNDDTESCSSIINITNDKNMNSNIDKISTSHSLKSISNIHNKETYFSPEKLKNKQKHITISGPVLPLLKDERNEYKSKSGGLIHNYTLKSSSGTSITTATSEKPNANNIPLDACIIKKKFNNFNCNNILNNDITTLNMSNNNSKYPSMSTSMVASPFLIEPSNYFKQYEEEERDKDNFDDRNIISYCSKNLFDNNDNKGRKSENSKTGKSSTKKLPYNTISLSSYHTYFSDKLDNKKLMVMIQMLFII